MVARDTGVAFTISHVDDHPGHMFLLMLPTVLPTR